MNMNNSLKEAFGQIHAEEELKSRTLSLIAEKTRGYSEGRPVRRRSPLCAMACACLLCMLLGGRWLYFTPTAEISIDINPSIELGINRFDRVIQVTGYNEDGLALSAALDVKYRPYTDAVEQIMSNASISRLLSADEVMTITVAGTDGAQSTEILSELEACTAGHGNTHCYSASAEEAAAAHQMGLSCGRYRAFSELLLLDPEITPEQVREMTMRELWELIDALSDGGDGSAGDYGSGESGHHGQGGHHHGHG